MIFRAGVETRTHGTLLTRINDQRRAGEARDVEAGGSDPGTVGVALVRCRNPGAEEVVLDHGYPAAGQLLAEGFFLHVLEGELGKALFRLGNGGTQKRLQTHAAGIDRRRLAAVTLDLSEQVALPALASLVVDNIADGHQVVAATQGEALGYREPLRVLPHQVDLKFVGVGLQFVA